MLVTYPPSRDPITLGGRSQHVTVEGTRLLSLYRAALLQQPTLYLAHTNGRPKQT